VVLLCATLVTAGDGNSSFTFYVQQSFPKQTRTNDQIKQINGMFGVHFDTWDDVANLSIGGQYFRKVDPNWQVGVEVDYSRGSISGRADVPTEAGEAGLRFEQKYSVYSDLLAVAHYLPCRTCERWTPFIYGGVGIGYEKDTTTLALRNAYIDEGLRVDNDGWFPVYTVGVGLDVYLSRARTLYVEAGGAYYWGRLTHKVKAEGALAPAPEVLADNDTTGPNIWVGIGWRF
jgi:opacity protein-like surface antigen